MLLTVIPHAVIYFTCGPLKPSLSLFHILNIVPCVLFTIRPFEFSISMKLVVLPVTHIDPWVGTDECAVSTLCIVLPLSFVKRSIFPVFFALSWFDSSHPVTLVLVFFYWIFFFAITMLESVLPFADVLCAILPDLCPLTMLQIFTINFNWLTIIFYIAWKSIYICFNLLIIVFSKVYCRLLNLHFS